MLLLLADVFDRFVLRFLGDCGGGGWVLAFVGHGLELILGHAFVLVGGGGGALVRSAQELGDAALVGKRLYDDVFGWRGGDFGEGSLLGHVAGDSGSGSRGLLGCCGGCRGGTSGCHFCD